MNKIVIGMLMSTGTATLMSGCAGVDSYYDRSPAAHQQGPVYQAPEPEPYRAHQRSDGFYQPPTTIYDQPPQPAYQPAYAGGQVAPAHSGVLYPDYPLYPVPAQPYGVYGQNQQPYAVAPQPPVYPPLAYSPSQAAAYPPAPNYGVAYPDVSTIQGRAVAVCGQVANEQVRKTGGSHSSLEQLVGLNQVGPNHFQVNAYASNHFPSGVKRQYLECDVANDEVVKFRVQ